MRVHNEEILEEALSFTTTRLESMLPNLNDSLKVQVTEALSQPILKTAPRVGARKYIYIYENSEARNDVLLKFAKLDFNMLQKLHQQEPNELARFVECYFFVSGMCVEPQYNRVRKMLTKLLCVNTSIDDTYDAYGIFDELLLFTDAIRRWDVRAMDSLPPYMQIIYQELLNIYNEMEEVFNKGKWESIYYRKDEMKEIVIAYMNESDWLNAGFIPKCEEYMTIARVTTGCMVYVTNYLLGMEKPVTKESIEWLRNRSLVVRAAAAICRYMDDIADHKVRAVHDSNSFRTQSPKIVPTEKATLPSIVHCHDFSLRGFKI
ncbi:(E,E)-germacrene B synthase [Capsicum annuum]|uniref:(E,E)-germacrene B synthase n=1 Tax=Capsicum annuum TaxID=4072 RepID=A0A2G2Z9V1_CAPAN|nr:(E,E)-germacrene B synthase [Capsicum annuum]PHT78793.1 (E,E)-germacrene B synthase [Capsicum annuum]